MSQVIGKELTGDLLTRLSGYDLSDKCGKAILIVTVDDQGWAHPAMLSYFEVVAKNSATIDCAVGRTSTTAKNLRRSGKLTLLVTDQRVNYYVKGSARELREAMEGVPFMSLFRVATEQILEDQEPDAEIVTGVTFRRPEKRAITDLVEKIFRAVRGEP